MSRGGWIVLAGVPVIGAAVYAGGVSMAPGGEAGIRAGVLVGCLVQLLLLALMRLAFPRKPMVAYGLGLLVRMIVVVVAALVALPATGLPAAPFLLSLVTVLFATTLLEPVALVADRRTES